MACCLTAPSHYLNWLIISEVQWRAISQEMSQPSITKIFLKITCIKFHANFPGANELISKLSVKWVTLSAWSCGVSHLVQYLFPSCLMRSGNVVYVGVKCIWYIKMQELSWCQPCRHWRWIFHSKRQTRQNFMFLCSVTEKAIEQIAQLPMIWDAMTLEWRHCNLPPQKVYERFCLPRIRHLRCDYFNRSLSKTLVCKSAK